MMCARGECKGSVAQTGLLASDITCIAPSGMVVHPARGWSRGKMIFPLPPFAPKILIFARRARSGAWCACSLTAVAGRASSAACTILRALPLCWECPPMRVELRGEAGIARKGTRWVGSSARAYDSCVRI